MYHTMFPCKVHGKLVQAEVPAFIEEMGSLFHVGMGLLTVAATPLRPAIAHESSARGLLSSCRN